MSRLALLTATEARETVELLPVLERLDPDGRGQGAGQLAADLARRLPAFTAWLCGRTP
ncbi:hypothetical protein [Streptomyces sp. NPDC002825]|uniref:hypothetical protein n=1 Tax=Streptomyces sp. NPDC002825 TaxID=3154666 RepID=UPI00332E3143